MPDGVHNWLELDRGSIRSSPRNGIGSTFKKNMEFWSLVTESFFTLDTSLMLGTWAYIIISELGTPH